MVQVRPCIIFIATNNSQLISKTHRYYEINSEIKLWLNENCKHSFAEVPNPRGVHVYFSDPNDAVIFKLFHQVT